MIFNTDLLKETRKPKLVVESDKSYFVYGVNRILEESRKLDSDIIKTFNDLNETLINHEALSLDLSGIFNSIAEYTKGIIEELYQDFKTNYQNKYYDSGYVTEHVDLNKMVNTTGNYNLRLIEDNSPYRLTCSGALMIEINHLKESLDKIEQVENEYHKEKLFCSTCIIEDCKDIIELFEHDMEMLRSRIIDENTSRSSIESEDWAKALYEHFRYTPYIPTNYEDFCKNRLDNITETYHHSKVILNDVTGVMINIQEAFSNINISNHDWIRKFDINKYINGRIIESAGEYVIEMLENKVKRIKFLADSYIEYFGAKLDAVVESYILCKEVGIL